MPDQSNGAPWRDTLLLAAAALALYLLLGQRTLHGDGGYFLRWVQTGRLEHEHHFAYLPLLWCWTRLLGLLGWNLYPAALLLSQVAMALGVLGMHRALARLLPRRQAFAAGLLVATCPSFVCFATVVELHAPFAAVASLACWQAARVAHGPGFTPGLVLGVTTGLGSLFHSSGQLLPWPLLLLVAAARWPAPPRALLSTAIGVAISHLLIVLAAPEVLRLAGFRLDPGKTIDFVQFWATRSGSGLEKLGGVLWQEWLRPYSPLSVVWLLAFLQPALRLPAMAFALAWLPYFAAAYLILGTNLEHGAYLQPLVCFLAWLTARAFPWRACLVAATVALLTAILLVREHDRADPDAYANGVRTLNGGDETLLILGSAEDYEGALIALPEVKIVTVSDLDVMASISGSRDAALAAIEANVRTWLLAGKKVYLTLGAETIMRDGLDGRTYPALGAVLEHLRLRFEFRSVRAGAFAAHELQAKV